MTSSRPYAILGCLFLTQGMSAQPVDFSIGARAGFSFTQRYTDQTNLTSATSVFRSDSQRAIFGPTFEAGFKERFAVEFSPTYRRDGFTLYNDFSARPFPLPPGSTTPLSQFVREKGFTWDLPLVGKYYLAGKDAGVRPFIGAGASATRHQRTVEIFSQIQPDAALRQAQALQSESTEWGFGPVVSGGVNLRSGRFSIVPEVRYLRDSSAPRGSRNRAEVFLGFRF